MSLTPHILCLAVSDFARDPRIARQLQVLQTCGNTWSAGLGPPADGSAFVPLQQRRRTPFRRALSLFQLITRRHWNFARDRFWLPDLASLPKEWDLIVSNDADLLPLAFRLAGKTTRILFDAHEYVPREFADRLYWRILHQPHRTWLCETYLPRLHGMLTVCDGIADEYEKTFRIPRPRMVPNMPPRQIAEPRPTPPDHIRLIHHGLASRSRRIEGMVDVMRHLDERFTLDFMLVPSEPGYIEWLKQRARGDNRIRFRDPVPTNEIVEETRNYDVGLYLLPPTNLNYQFILPNKFFEFIQARLAVAIGPSPEMARLVREHRLGVVARDFEPETLARALSALDAPIIDAAKHAAHRIAPIYCWENARTTLQEVVDSMLRRSCVE